jgi:hypothetical protein
MGTIRDVIYHRYNDSAFERVVYTESHDEVGALNGKRRLTADIDGNDPTSWYAKKRSTLGPHAERTGHGTRFWSGNSLRTEVVRPSGGHICALLGGQVVVK